MRRGEVRLADLAIAIERLGPVLGHLPAAVMDKVDDALRLRLAL